jgi:RasGEF N-terminal motif
VYEWESNHRRRTVKAAAIDQLVAHLFDYSYRDSDFTVIMLLLHRYFLPASVLFSKLAVYYNCTQCPSSVFNESTGEQQPGRGLRLPLRLSTPVTAQLDLSFWQIRMRERFLDLLRLVLVCVYVWMYFLLFSFLSCGRVGVVVFFFWTAS